MSRSICFVNGRHLSDPGATTTGVMVQEHLLGRELAGRGWRVTHVAGSSDPSLAGRVAEYEEMTVIFLPDHRHLPLRHLGRWRRGLAGVDADVFYQRGRGPLTWLAAEVSGRRGSLFVWSSAGETGVRRGKNRREVLPRKSGFLRRAALLPWAILQDALYERGIERADLLLAQTRTQAELLEREFGRKGFVMPSGHPVPEPTSLAKPSPPLVLWAGALKESKQPTMFVDLARRPGGPDARFVMAGALADERYLPAIVAAERELPSFAWRGQVAFDDTAPLFAEAALLVNTTREGHEGLPNAFIQAMLHGTPIVSLWCDPDGMLEREQAGFAARGNVERLAADLWRLVGDAPLRERMGRAARTFAERAYGLPAVADRLEAAIAGALAARGRPR